ncbi:MAG: RHS repeat domain-containing protein, partial [Blastocatellia bacterium]
VYNRAGLLTDETYPSRTKTVHTDYDSAGRVLGVKNAGTGVYYAGSGSSPTGIQYSPEGGVAKMPLGNGLIEQTTYNTRLQATLIQLGTASAPSSVLELTYGYNESSGTDNGNVVQQIIKVGAAEVGTQTYGYDGLNRLMTAQEKQNGAIQWTQSFDYDRFGNMAITQSDIPLSLLTPRNISTDFDPATNRVTINGYSYDNNGNLKTDPHTNAQTGYTYDAENRMTGFNASSGNSAAAYSYDGDGRRVKKQATDPNGTTTTIYVYNAMGQLIAEYPTPTPTATGTSYLTTDHLGSTRVITAPDQSVRYRTDYSPFGQEIGTFGSGRTASGYSNSTDIHQKFTSKERDDESSLDFFEARYFSSAQGRFISPDSVAGSPLSPQTLNLYSYVSNSPLCYTDPTGHYQDPSGRPPLQFDDNGKPLVKETITVKASDCPTVLMDISLQAYAEFIRTHHNKEGLVPWEVRRPFSVAGLRAPEFLWPRVTVWIDPRRIDYEKVFPLMQLAAIPIDGEVPLIEPEIPAEEAAESAPNTTPGRAQGGGDSGAGRLPNLDGATREEAGTILRETGFEYKGTTPGGYEKWYHPDGSRVQIRPDGEVVRSGPKAGQGYRPRIGPDGQPTASHNTGERVQ